MRVRALRRALAALIAGTAIVLPIVVAPAAQATTGLDYVALGDSYTAGPGISPGDSSAPLICLRSKANYPHIDAARNGWNLKDVSCSAATSADMTSTQLLTSGPQFNALSASTDVVTVGIGGNDNNLFIGALAACGSIDIFNVFNIGAPCKAVWGNTFDNAVDSDAATIARVFQGIHQRSPNAKVFALGYPDILPQSGSCWPTMPLTTGDVAYMNALEKHLNAMIQSVAAANNVTFVDTFTSSIGHDPCKSGSTQWV